MRAVSLLAIGLLACANGAPHRGERRAAARAQRPAPAVDPASPTAPTVEAAAPTAPAAPPAVPAPEDCPAPAASLPSVQPGRRGLSFTLLDLGAPGLQPRRVVVRVPRSYDDEPARRFPVLYVHDGQGAFEDGLDLGRVLDALAEDGTVEPTIVVAIDTTSQRSNELTPSRAGTLEPSVTRYGAFVSKVVKPLVDRHFRTRCGRSSTAVLGYSYGGLADLYLAMEHPDVFGRVVCMSPSFWWGRGVALRDFARYDGRLPERLWIDVGTEEGRKREAIPYMVADARAVRDLALDKGMTFGEDLGYLEEPGAQHGLAWGAARVRHALAFALSGRRPLAAPSGLAVRLFQGALPSPAGRRATTLAVETAHGDAVRLTWPLARVGLRVMDERVARIDDGFRLVAGARGLTEVEARLGDKVATARLEVR